MIGNKHPLTRLGLAIATTAVVAIGCGTSEYMERVERGLKGLTVGAVFTSLYDEPSTIPGTPVKLRLPKFVDGQAKAYTQDSADPSGQGQVKPGRLQPPFLQIPGLRICYEMLTIDDSTGALMPYYCYLSAVPAGEAGPIEESIQTQVSAAVPGTQPWASIVCTAPSGAPTNWKRLTATGPQDFLDQTGKVINVPGVFELFTSEIDGWRVLIGWRAPQGLSKKVVDVAPAVAGTVTAGQAAAANPAAAAAGRDGALPGAGVGAAAVGVVPGISP